MKKKTNTFEDTSAYDERSENDDGHIALPMPSHYSGVLSDVLMAHLEVGPVTLDGVLNGRKISFEVELSGKFINAYLTIDTFRTRRLETVAVLAGTKQWFYTSNFNKLLETSEIDHWSRTIHRCWR